MLVYLVLAALVALCSSWSSPVAALKDTYYWRPALRFTPAMNWINDPNGLVYDSSTGLWHLFGQYNPYGEVWGSMSWLHAVSKDLIQWEQWPLAILTGTDVAIFSGTAVMDYNTSGLCEASVPCLVCIWAGDGLGKETINLAYATDAKLSVFAKYTNNPVIDPNLANFRDPAVFWWDTDTKTRSSAASGSGYWVVVIAHSDASKVEIWHSSNLTQWTKVSEFGPANNPGSWECPDLFPLINGDTNDTQWVLTVSIGGTPGSYWIGDFDGTTFTSTSSAQPIDAGMDWYASITYNEAPNNRRVQMAWVSFGAYQSQTPTSPWRGSYSLPRELTLHQHKDASGNTIDLVHANPVQETYTYRNQRYALSEPQLIEAGNDGSAIIRDQLGFRGVAIYEIHANLNTTCPTAATAPCQFEFVLRHNEDTQQGFRVGVIVPKDGSPLIHYMDRSNSGVTNLPAPFTQLHTATMVAVTESLSRAAAIDFHLVYDVSGVEVYLQDGLMAASYQFFPSPFERNYGLQFNVVSGEVTLNTLEIWNYNEPMQGRHSESEAARE